ncbi:hypothetical protein [Tepidibacter hydrothermalis]|uniref:Uncharacterized protein n=1 Tax=Tepidibacter hydrothermalis TaxID=3036126 RepID=A0ABY8EAY6_9FIRM|nr:hypothetical protein [Tepidibacter hydrothermalis]WFD08764.1 hypothetical protein P4S50_10175 [Tepidibacter hydrothermalis]
MKIWTEKKSLDLEKLIKNIDNNYNIQTINNIWKFDRKIKGPGGYCLEYSSYSDLHYPKFNQLIIYLKKIRDYVECNNCTEHLGKVFELLVNYLLEIIKLFLFECDFGIQVKHKNINLKKALNILSKKREYDDILKTIQNFIKLYEKSKFTYINLDVNKGITNSDIVISYFALRKIGEQLLKKDDNYKKYNNDNNILIKCTNIRSIRKAEQVILNRNNRKNKKRVYDRKDYRLTINDYIKNRRFILEKKGDIFFKSSKYKGCYLYNPIFVNNYLFISVKNNKKNFNLIIIDLRTKKLYHKYFSIMDIDTMDREDIVFIEFLSNKIVVCTKNTKFTYDKERYFVNEMSTNIRLLKVINKIKGYEYDFIFAISSIFTLISTGIYLYKGFKWILPIIIMVTILYRVIFNFLNKSNKDTSKKLDKGEMNIYCMIFAFLTVFIHILIGLSAIFVAVIPYLLNYI